MSQRTSATALAGGGQNSFRLTMLFHPSHHVTDLSEAENFFERVFGRPSTRLATGYATFTPIAEVLFDCIDPTLNIVNNAQVYATPSEPHLHNLGWYVEGISEAFRAFQQHGIRLTAVSGAAADGDEPPRAGGQVPMFFTVPDDAGQRYQFVAAGPMAVDYRLEPGWTLPPVSSGDPLGIERCARHVVLTRNLGRSLRFIVDVAGGKVIHESRNEEIGADSTYVHLADAVFEYAAPDENTPAAADWATHAPYDTYHSVVWKVADLDRVARQLQAHGVRIRTRTDESIITEPSTSLGIPWGFTTAYTSGDPRAAG